MTHIEDYALIGDRRSAALVGPDGSVDWLCLPRFDSSAVFAGLLGADAHGCWRLAPVSGGTTCHRAYLGDTLILRSDWYTPDGAVQVTDFMPPEGPQALIRIVEGRHGSVRMRSRLLARPDYGRVTPRTRRLGTNDAVAEAGPDAYVLEGSSPLDPPCATDPCAITATFTVAAGERHVFTLRHRPGHDHSHPHINAQRALLRTERFWTDWASRCTYTGPQRDAVVRSLITLKALTHAPTGGIVAAATTSLPEDLGGVRNWDYRYTWLRDAAMTLNAFLAAGYLEEAGAWRAWLLRTVAGDPEHLQIMYGVGGERRLTEHTADWLPGYEGSRPVRIGNAAATQFQLDVYGEVLDTLHRAHLAGLACDPDTTALVVELAGAVADRWREPDEGIWEVRGPRRHFVHSKVMAWVALDRALRILDTDPGTVVDGGIRDRLRRERDAIHREVCERGYDTERNTFTQFYGSRELDGALLLVPAVGFLPPDDKRVIGTVEAVQRDLTRDGLVLRYTSDPGHRGAVDGLPGSEGAFLACSFWLVDALTLIGRMDEARLLFDRLLALRNAFGLLAEEWDVSRRRQVGNYPQAFSHGPLVETAALLGVSPAATPIASATLAGAAT